MLVLLYLMFALPAQNGISNLPMANWLMAGLFASLPLLAFPIRSLLISYFAILYRLLITSTEPSLVLSSTLPYRPYIPSYSSPPSRFSLSTPPV